MNPRRIKFQDVYSISVCELSRIRSTLIDAMMTQRSYSKFLSILALGNSFLSDISLMKIFLKSFRIIYQNVFFTTSLRTLVLNNEAQLEQYLRSYINYLRLNLVWFNTSILMCLCCDWVREEVMKNKSRKNRSRKIRKEVSMHLISKKKASILIVDYIKLLIYK